MSLVLSLSPGFLAVVRLREVLLWVVLHAEKYMCLKEKESLKYKKMPKRRMFQRKLCIFPQGFLSMVIL